MQLKGPSSFPPFREFRRYRADPIGYLRAGVRQYGPTFSFRLGPMKVHFFSRPEDVEHVYSRPKDFVRSTLIQKVVPVTGKSILVSIGERWRKKRLAAQPVFHPSSIDALFTAMNDVVDRHMTLWQAHGESFFDVRAASVALAAEVATTTLFGLPISELPPGFLKALDDTFETIRLRVENPFALPLWVPTGANRRLHAAVSEFDALVFPIVDKVLAGKVAQDSLLARLEKSLRAENGRADRRELRDEVTTYLLASIETSATTMSWAIYELARAPEWVEKLRQEASGAPRTREELRSRPQVRRVVAEALRLHPPAWFTDFAAAQDTELNGVTIQRGEHVWLSQYVTHRDPAVWRQPDRFDPTHFDAEEEKRRPKYAYFPFGAAARHCIGQHFAQMELDLTISEVFRRFDVETDGARVDEAPGFVLRVGSPVNVRVRPRPSV